MITFKELSYKNFQSVGNTPIKISLDRNSSTLLGGHNGSGKSNVLEALVYCMFGKPLKKVKLGQLINSTNKKNLLVECSFNVKGQDYVVRRGQKPTVFEILKNGDSLLDQNASSRDYQTRLEQIIGMDYKLFTQVVVLNKERYTPFMELEAPARRKIIEDILNISIFSLMSDVLKKKISENNNETTNLSFDVSSIENRISALERLIKQAEENVGNRNAEIKEEIQELITEIKELSAAKDEIEIPEFDETVFNKLKSIANGLERTKMSADNNIARSEKSIETYNNYTHCSECGSEISDEKRDELISEYRTKIRECEADLNSVANKLPKVQLHIDKITETHENRRVAEQQKQSYEQRISEKKRAIVRLDNSIVKETENTQLNKYREELDNEHNTLTSTSDSYNTALKTQDMLKQCKAYLKDDGIKAEIVSDYIDFINETMNEYLNTMEFYINIKIDENFKDSILAINKEGFTYDNLSTGQKCRVNLAIWLTLLEVATIKNSVVTNVLFLDEILEPVDTQGVSLIMKLFADKLKSKNIFVVTQRFREFEDYFQTSIEFKLDQGFTTIL